MGDFGTMVFGAAGVVIIVLALRYFLRWQKNAPHDETAADLRTQKDEHGNTIFVRCPVCNTPLAKTDNLASKIFRPMDTPDQRMIVMGCPHCYPVLQSAPFPWTATWLPACLITAPAKNTSSSPAAQKKQRSNNTATEYLRIRVFVVY